MRSPIFVLHPRKNYWTYTVDGQSLKSKIKQKNTIKLDAAERDHFGTDNINQTIFLTGPIRSN